MPWTGRMETVHHEPKGVVSGSRGRASLKRKEGERMKLRTLIATLAIVTLASGVAYAASRFSATASEFDPGNTFLVQAEWLDGIGCPTNGRIAVPNADFTGVSGTAPYSDTGCPTGDTSDNHNQGLLWSKPAHRTTLPLRPRR